MSNPSPAQIPAGSPWPFGVQWVEADDAFNFSLYSRHATGVTLLCYTEEDPARPVFEFRFRHPAHKTGSVWHCRIPASELRGATLYAYRVEGPHEPEHGQRFDPAEGPARSLRAVGVLPASVQPRSVRRCGPDRRPCAARPSAGQGDAGPSDRARPRDTRAGTPSSTNCTSKDSPRARTPASRPRSAARSPA